MGFSERLLAENKPADSVTHGYSLVRLFVTSAQEPAESPDLAPYTWNYYAATEFSLGGLIKLWIVGE